MPDFRIPPDFLDHTVARLDAIGMTGQDKRDAFAIVSLILANLDPLSFSTSRKRADLAARLDLDPSRWGIVISELERAGLVSRGRRRNGEPTISIRPAGVRPVGRPGAYA